MCLKFFKSKQQPKTTLRSNPKSTSSALRLTPISPPPLSQEIIKARQHNYADPAFTTLPIELLLLIISFATPPSIMALRGTCTRFRILCLDPTASESNILYVETWRRQYTEQRKRYQVQQLCAAESATSSEHTGQKELVCSMCIAWHPSSLFTPAMRDVPPEERKCIGWTSELYLCQHKSVTLATLRHFRPSVWCGLAHSPTASYLCTVMSPNSCLGVSPFTNVPSVARDLSGGGRGVRVGIVGRGVDEEGRLVAGGVGKSLEWEGIGRQGFVDRDIVVRSEIVVQRLGKGEKISGNESVDGRDVVQAVEMVVMRERRAVHRMEKKEVRKMKYQKAMANKKGERIGAVGERDEERSLLSMCPHLRPDVAVELLTKYPYEDCPELEKHDLETVPCRSARSNRVCGRRYHCPNPECETFFYLYRARFFDFTHGHKDELVLCVVRNLGACRDALDKRWLAQVEKTCSEDEKLKLGRPRVSLRIGDDGGFGVD